MTTEAQLAVVSAIKDAATNAAYQAHGEILASASATVAHITTATSQAGATASQQVSTSLVTAPSVVVIQPGPINRFIAFLLGLLKKL